MIPSKWIRAAIYSLVLTVPVAQADEPLQVTGLADGVHELDLFDTQSGTYMHSEPATTLNFPIQILLDRQGDYIIELQGQQYAIGSTLVTTNKQVSLKAEPVCDNTMAQPTGATRGITGKGCKQ